MSSPVWPPTGARPETERNPYSQMSEYEPEHLTYHPSVPPSIAEIAIPALASTTNEALRSASSSLGELARTVTMSGLQVDSLLAGVLIRYEAVSSSQIEDLDADVEVELVHDHGALAFADEAEEALVSRNVSVVAGAITQDAPVTAEWLCELHDRLLRGSGLLGRHVGQFRDVPVWIGASRAAADFEGSPADLVPPLVADLCAFVDRSDVQPVVAAAIAHAQFETIHPFADGNGRIGRALIHPLLRRAAPNAIVPASAALLAARSRYFEGLGAYRRGDLDEWVTTFATAVAVAARAATAVTIGLDRLRGEWGEQVRSHRDGTARAVLEHLPTDPVVTVASARALLGVSQPAAHQAIKRLEEAGVLRPTAVETPGKAKVWVAGGVLDVLGSLDRIIGRREP
ncbi:MAG: Fic family protein [Acidimicrobiales bacterium]